jgi:cytochrome c-type biogenesis protein CcmH
MWGALGESLALVNDGMVVPDALEAFGQALTLDKSDPRARFYLGLARGQLGKYAEAVSIWRDLEKDSPADAPWLPVLKQHITEFARQGGFDAASIKPVPPATEGSKTASGMADFHATPLASSSATMSSPWEVRSGEAAAAVMAAPPAERDKSVRSMVDGLAAHLEQTPNDLEGWLRLARSYRMLGEFDKAIDAAKRAVALKPHEVGPILALAEAQLAASKSDQLSADFIATMKDVLAVEPANGEALYYVGAAEAQVGHTDKARQLWSRLLNTLPQDSIQRQTLINQIDALPKS